MGELLYWCKCALGPLCVLQMQRPSSENIVLSNTQIQTFTVGSLRMRADEYTCCDELYKKQAPKHQSLWSTDSLSQPHHLLSSRLVNKNEEPTSTSLIWGPRNLQTTIHGKQGNLLKSKVWSRQPSWKPKEMNNNSLVSMWQRKRSQLSDLG